MKHFLFTSLISVAVFSLIVGFSKEGLATGNGVSGGGTGTLYQGTFVFFDLLETIQTIVDSQNIKSISTDEKMKPLTFEVMTIDQLPGFKMIQEMGKINSDLQQIYLSALAEVVWVKTNAELKPLYDVFPIPDNEQEKSSLVQVAIHFNGLVTVNDLLFSLLGDVYQAAGIVHETVRVMAYHRNISISTQEVQEITEALMNGRKHPLFTKLIQTPDLQTLNKVNLEWHYQRVMELGKIRETITDSDVRTKINHEIKKLVREWRNLEEERTTWFDFRSAVANKSLNVNYIYSLIKESKYVGGDELVTTPKVNY